MSKIWKSTKIRLLAVGILVATLIMSFSPINFYVNPTMPLSQSKSLTVGNERLVLTIGNQAHASGTLDYAWNGVNDNVNVAAAVAVLNSHGGGELVMMTENYTFLASVNVPANVMIRGLGASTKISFNGVNPVFVATGANVVFRDFNTDAGGVTALSTTVVENVNGNTPTGRGAIIVASVNATAIVKAQADYIADGTADDVQIQAAINSLTPNRINPETVTPIGSFLISNTITVPSYTVLDLRQATITLADNSNKDMILFTSDIFGAGGVSYKSSILGGVLNGNGGSQTNGNGLLLRGYQCTIDGLTIIDTKEHGILLNQGTSVNSWENTLTNLRIYGWYGSNGGVYFSGTSTDNILTNSIIYKTTHDATSGTCVIVQAAGNIIANNHFFGGFSLLTIQNKFATVVSGNYFDSVSNGGGNQLAIVGSGGVGSWGITVTGNQFWGNGTWSERILLSGDAPGMVHDVSITGNSFIAPTGTVTNDIHGINTDNITVIGNNGMKISATTPINISGTNTIIRSNTGFVTENSGSANITASTGAIDVSHGLDVTPLRVFVTLAGNPGVVTNVYSGNISSTKFTISATTNFTNNTAINWKAIAYEGN